MQQLIEQVLNYLRGMWQRRWIGLAVAWIAVAAGSVWVFRLPDQYEASARVYVDTQSMLKPLMSGMTVSPDAGQQTAILSRTLLSRPNIAKIIRKSDLDTARRTSADSLVDETTTSLRISRAPFGDNLYTIAFRYTDPKKARDVVQAALSTFIEQSLGESRTGADAARKFIDEQIKDYELRLREAEARVHAFRLKYMGLFPTGGKDFVGAMAAVSDQIKDAKLELRVAEQTRDGIKQQLQDLSKSHESKATESANTAVKIAVPELDTRISQAQRQVDELLRNFTEQHPDVISNRRLLAKLIEERDHEVAVRRKALAERPEAIPAGDPVADQLKVALTEAESNVTTVRARLAEFEARYTQIKANAEALPRIDTEWTQLNRDYDIQKRQYEQLVARRETAQMTGKLEDAGVAEFRIIDPPRVTPTPVAPNRYLLLWGLVAGSFAAGLATSFAVSQIRPTFHDGRTLCELAGRPLLGLVAMIEGPQLRMRRRRSALLFASGVGGLIASYAAAFTITYLVRGI
jgi:protein tyrosine kinase modulator